MLVANLISNSYAFENFDLALRYNRNTLGNIVIFSYSRLHKLLRTKNKGYYVFLPSAAFHLIFQQFKGTCTFAHVLYIEESGILQKFGIFQNPEPT